MFKKIFVFISVSILVLSAKAQQDPQYTHYIFNENQFNPAYTGSRELLSTNMLFRTQWVGFEGAPTTFTFGANAPLKKDKIALGGTFYYDKIGAQNRISMNLQYAYRISVGKQSKISLGVQGGFVAQKTNLSILDAANEGDPIYLNLKPMQFMPNFGAGIYIYSPKYAIGFSAPHILNNEMVNKEIINLNNHYLFTAATIFNAGSSLKIKPTLLAKFVKGSPIQGELNANLIIKDAVWLGFGYRTDNAGLFTAQYNLIKDKEQKYTNLRIGYGYDLEWKQLRQNSGGSHEIFLSYEFKKKKLDDTYLSPRYF